MATLTIADLDNGKRDLETVDAVANSQADTTTTRYGQQTLTLAGALRRLGYAPPVPYAPGLTMTSGLTTVARNGVIYAPRVEQLPFTTGAWDPGQWCVVQNADGSNLVYQFATLAKAQSAAATLPDGSSIIVEGISQGHAIGGTYVVSSGTPAASVLDYAEFDALTAPANIVDVRAPGIAGRWRYAPGSTATPDGGLVRKLTDGRIFIRDGAFVMACVTPSLFREASDPANDDTLSIQRALNTRMRVELPAAVRITTSLTHYGQQIVGTGVTVNSGTWAMTKIHVDGNFAAFVPSPTSPVSSDISGLFIWYADTTPTTATGNDQKVGFSFPNPGFPNPAVANPQFTKISNCLVKGGWRAYDASGGAYLFKLERVWSWSCRFGFRHVGGTTFSMDTCYALFGEQAYFMQGIANFTMTNCAMDQMVVTTTTPQRAASVFADIPGLSISGFYTELNKVSVDAGSMVMFINCIGSISNVSRWREALSCTTGQEVYGYRVYGGRLKMSGFAQQATGNQGFQFTGTGIVMGLVVQNGALVNLEVSDFEAPTGGSPSLRYAVGAFGSNTTVMRDDLTSVSGGANSSIVSSASKAVAFSPVLVNATITGAAPTVTGSYMQHGGMTYINVQIAVSGGTVAFVPNSTAITGIPFAATTSCAITGVTTDAAGFFAAVRGSQIVMPYLAATSASIAISGVYQTR